MIRPETITRKQARQLVKLLEQWTRAEIMARCAPLGWPDAGDYHFQKLEIENKIRRGLFGTDDLFSLGQKWCMLKDKKHKKSEKKSRLGPF